MASEEPKKVKSPEEYVIFEGIDGIECEDFIHLVRRRAREEGKQRDNEWIVDYVATCLVGDALRWYLGLEEEVQEDWKLLQQALISKYPPVKVSRFSASSNQTSRESRYREMILSAIPTTLKPGAEASPVPIPQAPKERTGRLRVIADNASYNGYVSRSFGSDGAAVFNAAQNQAMTIKYTPGTGPFRIDMTNCANGYQWLGASLRDKSNKLGPGGLAYASVTGMNNSNYGSVACPTNWGGPRRAIMWSVGPDDTITATWDFNGTIYDISTVATHTSSRQLMYLVADFTAFNNWQGGYYAKARLAFEPIN